LLATPLDMCALIKQKQQLCGFPVILLDNVLLMYNLCRQHNGNPVGNENFVNESNGADGEYLVWNIWIYLDIWIFGYI